MKEQIVEAELKSRYDWGLTILIALMGLLLLLGVMRNGRAIRTLEPLVFAGIGEDEERRDVLEFIAGPIKITENDDGEIQKIEHWDGKEYGGPAQFSSFSRPVVESGEENVIDITTGVGLGTISASMPEPDLMIAAGDIIDRPKEPTQEDVALLPENFTALSYPYDVTMVDHDGILVVLNQAGDNESEITFVSDAVVDFVFASGKVCEREVRGLEYVGRHDWSTKYNKPYDSSTYGDVRRIPLSRKCRRCGKAQVFKPALWPDEWVDVEDEQ